MLTADLVHASRRGDKLHVTRLKGARLERASALAEAMVSVLGDSVGAQRGALTNALFALETAARDRKLVRGLAKLALQRCEFEVASAVAPIELRRSVFVAAATARKSGVFARDDVLAAVAEAVEMDADQIDPALFADLKTTHRLVAWQTQTGTELLDNYELAQAQAVLLRATAVEVRVFAKDVNAYRRLFHRLKFHRLLWRCEAIEDGKKQGYKLNIDGPFALFAQSTRYGMQLAMILPLLRQMDRFELTAQVQWGKHRTPLTFETKGRGRAALLPLRLADDVQRLLDDIKALKGDWKVDVSDAVLDVPGVGVVVPDLRLRRVDKKDGSKKDGNRKEQREVLIEVMGYWSRDAVWRRVEAAEAGLAKPVLFVASRRLRVSEAVLTDDMGAALYVYKGVISARAVVEKAEKLASS